MFNGCVRVRFWSRFVLPALDTMKLSHNNALIFFWLCVQMIFVLLDCRVRLKTEMEKAVFQVTVSLNIRKGSVAETLPPSRRNKE